MSTKSVNTHLNRLLLEYPTEAGDLFNQDFLSNNKPVHFYKAFNLANTTTETRYAKYCQYARKEDQTPLDYHSWWSQYSEAHGGRHTTYMPEFYVPSSYETSTPPLCFHFHGSMTYKGRSYNRKSIRQLLALCMDTEIFKSDVVDTHAIRRGESCSVNGFAFVVKDRKYALRSEDFRRMLSSVHYTANGEYFDPYQENTYLPDYDTAVARLFDKNGKPHRLFRILCWTFEEYMEYVINGNATILSPSRRELKSTPIRRPAPAATLQECHDTLSTWLKNGTMQNLAKFSDASNARTSHIPIFSLAGALSHSASISDDCPPPEIRQTSRPEWGDLRGLLAGKELHVLSRTLSPRPEAV